MAVKGKVPPHALLMGDCSSGSHEAPGGKWSPGDRPVRACKGIMTYTVAGIVKTHLCACKCHKEISEMYELSGMERVWPETSWRSEADRRAFKATQPQFDMTYVEEWKATSVPIPLPHDAHEPAPGIEEVDKLRDLGVSVIIPDNPTFTKSPDWREGMPRTSGQLEYEVKIACDAFVLGAYPQEMTSFTPRSISRAINSVKPPSTGAIVNILTAWGELGFANVTTGPHAFLGYTKAGIQLGLNQLRQRKAATSASVTKARNVHMLRGHRTK